MTSYRTPALRVIGHALWIGSLLTLLAIIAVSVWLDSTTGGYGLTSVLLTIRLYGITRLPTSAALSVLIGALTAAAMNTRSRIARAGILAGGYALVMVLLDALVQLTYHASAWSKWLTPPLSLWIIVTAAGAAGLAWRQRKQDLRLPPAARRIAWRLIAAGLVLVIARQGWLLVQHGRYHSPYSSQTASSSSAGGVDEAPAQTYPTAEPVEPLDPAVPVAAVREDLSALYDSTLRAAGPDLLWVVPLSVYEAPCTNSSGADGTKVSLTGQFSTRDLDTAADNVDFLEITQANEAVARQIADTWVADGLMGNPDVMKGNFYFGDRGRGTLASAKIDFDQGNGNIDVAGRCATYA